MDILMRHKDFPDRKPTTTTLNAFNNIWAEKGWEMVDGGPAYEEPGTAPLLDEMSVADLKSLAADLDIPGRSSMSKTKLIKAIEDWPEYAAG